MSAKTIGRICGVVVAAVLLGQPAVTSAQTAAKSPKTGAREGGAAPRDGQHDLDWMIGTWKAKLKRLVHPLTGSTTWVEFEGTQITRSIWGGRGIMDEFSVHSPETNTHVEGLTLRLYNPESHQWHIYWANAKRGMLDLPPVVGGFENGRGEFYDQELFEGRAIFCRYVWSDITPTSARFEQSFSDDGGKTWEPNWISTIERIKK